MNLVNLIVAFPASISLALLINEVSSTRYKKTLQTVTYLPYILSMVMVGMMCDMFSSTGIADSIL